MNMRLISRFLLSLVILMIFVSSGLAHPDAVRKSDQKSFSDQDYQQCKNVKEFDERLRLEIRSKLKEVNKIINLVLNGTEKHTTYNELSKFCDTFGPRLSGSDSLSRAINYMANKMTQSSDEMRLESVMIPKWEIHDQWAEIVRPVKHKMTILTLGTSVSTSGKPLEAEAILVHSFDELNRLGREGQIDNKIVVYNFKFTTYSESVGFRTRGASEAAKFGASAALVRSVTPGSIYSPHTGMGSQSIPTASITTEDADLLQRWQDRGEKLKLRLFIDSKNFNDSESFNIVGDLKGNKKPEEIVLISGHVDSWYNTQGAMDDAGGMMISYKAIDILNKLNLRARRTIRAVLWTSEEFGLVGAQQYMKTHKNEISQHKIVMESDLGTFKPLGLSYANANPLLKCIVSELLKLTSSIGTDNLDDNYEGSDIGLFTELGTPSFSLLNDNKKYFYYHHTAGDTMSLEDPDDLDKTTILWAVASYILADLTIDIPTELNAK